MSPNQNHENLDLYDGPNPYPTLSENAAYTISTREMPRLVDNIIRNIAESAHTSHEDENKTERFWSSMTTVVQFEKIQKPIDMYWADAPFIDLVVDIATSPEYLDFMQNRNSGAPSSEGILMFETPLVTTVSRLKSTPANKEGWEGITYGSTTVPLAGIIWRHEYEESMGTFLHMMGIVGYEDPTFIPGYDEKSSILFEPAFEEFEHSTPHGAITLATILRSFFLALNQDTFVIKHNEKRPGADTTSRRITHPGSKQTHHELRIIVKRPGATIHTYSTSNQRDGKPLAYRTPVRTYRRFKGLPEEQQVIAHTRGADKPVRPGEIVIAVRRPNRSTDQ